MTSAEHFAKAEQFIGSVELTIEDMDPDSPTRYRVQRDLCQLALIQALVHAVLAVGADRGCT